ncbi:hypothetical protein Mpt1_c11040 [Candidatus Methanoplasma termitum]|uniref:Uncharacterized protein n=1 Tax=Candidatus Methanoplasma termitum TaxID=1577791 RepID=A0A0A7LHH8_9ARCH|nr:hypothetical protein [Candidatus Methanoplasma termitum]AIZ56971.1 hypothetical protein Mpt1_c11040 [Candidatus Methanoplasma termitum]MCL2333285.1 hypothetical protein [Candidatus Methanoplasma sp.]
MRQADTVILYEGNEGLCETKITAKIENGCLEIFGHIFDDSAMTCTWRDEREYRYKLNEEDTSELIRIISNYGNGPGESLIRHFGGKNGCTRFQKFCSENGLRYEYAAWPELIPK